MSPVESVSRFTCGWKYSGYVALSASFVFNSIRMMSQVLKNRVDRRKQTALTRPCCLSEFYGPGEPYNKLTGKDASRAIAKWSVAEEDLNDDLVRTVQ